MKAIIIGLLCFSMCMNIYAQKKSDLLKEVMELYESVQNECARSSYYVEFPRIYESASKSELLKAKEDLLKIQQDLTDKKESEGNKAILLKDLGTLSARVCALEKELGSYDLNYKNRPDVNMEGRIQLSAGCSLEDMENEKERLENVEERFKKAIPIAKKEYEARELEKQQERQREDSIYYAQLASDWTWISQGQKSDGYIWKSVEKSYPEKDFYYIHKRFPQYQVRGDCAFKCDTLVGIDATGYSSSFTLRDEVEKMTYQFDFKNNKYDIQKESAEMIAAVKKELGLVDPPKNTKEGDKLMKLELEYSQAQMDYKLGKITKNDFLKIKNKLVSAGTDVLADVLIQNEKDKPLRDRVEQYMRQLKLDHEKDFNKDGRVERIDGTSFYLTYGRIKVKLSYYTSGKYQVERRIEIVEFPK